MIFTKHLKILYNFYSNRKLISWAIFLIFLISTLIDTFLIYLLTSNAINLAIDHKIHYLNIIFMLMAIKTIFFISSNYLIKKSFLDLFYKALRKFFLFLPANKGLFGNSQIATNLLKFESEINFIIFDSNSFYFNIMLRISKFVAFLIVIGIVNFNYVHSYNVAIFVIANLFFIPISILHYYENIKEKQYQTKIEKYLGTTNEVVLNYIEQNININIDDNNSKETGDNFSDFISNIMKTLFSEIKNIMLVRFSFHFLNLFSIFIYATILILSSYYFFNPYNLVLIISYIIFNLLLVRSLYELSNYFANKYLFSSLAQANIINMGNYQYGNLNGSQGNSSKPNLNIESIEFKNATIYLDNEIQDKQLDYLNILIKPQNLIAFIATDTSPIEIFEKITNDNFRIKNGEILINNHNINSIDKENLENFIKFVGVDNLDYNAHIKKNLIGENEAISEELIAQACRISGLSEFISTLSLGYYTKLDDIALTNIEKFQIALTKILLADAQVIILNFLDTDENHEMIKKIKKIILQTLPDRITIFIVNNSNFLELFNTIYMFENSTIIASGNHKELLDNIQYSHFFLKNSHNIIFNE